MSNPIKQLHNDFILNKLHFLLADSTRRYFQRLNCPSLCGVEVTFALKNIRKPQLEQLELRPSVTIAA